jgi:hypothetical protein
MPDTPLTGGPVSQAAAALNNVGKLPFNVANRAIRGVAGLPQGMAQAGWDLTQGHPEGVDPFTMAENSYKGTQQDTEALGPMAALGNLGGDATTMYLAGKFGPRVAEAATAPITDIVNRVRNAPVAFARAATNTGKGSIEQLVAKKQAANDVIDGVNEDRTEAQQTAQTTATQNYNRKIGQTAQQNRATTAAERAKAAQDAHLQVGGSQLIYGLRQLDKALRARAGVMYDAIREKVGDATLPGTDLAVAARAALSKISGTSVTPSIFRDILGKYPEAEPETIAYQGAQIPRGHPLYNVLAKNGAVEAPPITFADLQGYYSELGAELSKGNLPGDVYQATRALQDSIGDMMQKQAKSAGVGDLFVSARKFYRNYMDTFHEPAGPSSSGSPVAQALLAKDPTVAVDKFAGDSGARGIADLRRYSDSLANLAQDVRQHAQAKITIPTRKTMAGTSQPNVPLELKPQQTISSPDIVAARRAAAETRANKVWNRGQWAATWPIFQAARALWGGHIPSIPMMGLESAGMLATVKATTGLLRYPPMIRFLEQARPEDVLLIPPELRGDLPGLVSQAQQQGIKVAPALTAAAAGTSAGATGRSQDMPSLPSQVTQAIQAIQAMQPVGGAQ